MHASVAIPVADIEIPALWGYGNFSWSIEGGTSLRGCAVIASADLTQQRAFRGEAPNPVAFVIDTEKNTVLIDRNAVRPGEQALSPTAKKGSILSENHDGVVAATKQIDVILHVDSNINHLTQVHTIRKMLILHTHEF